MLCSFIGVRMYMHEFVPFLTTKSYGMKMKVSYGMKMTLSFEFTCYNGTTTENQTNTAEQSVGV